MFQYKVLSLNCLIFKKSHLIYCIKIDHVFKLSSGKQNLWNSQFLRCMYVQYNQLFVKMGVYGCREVVVEWCCQFLPTLLIKSLPAQGSLFVDVYISEVMWMLMHACMCVLLMCRGVLNHKVLPLVNVLLKTSWLFMRKVFFFFPLRLSRDPLSKSSVWVSQRNLQRNQQSTDTPTE